MEVILGILIGISAILLVFVLRSLTTLFHELGHAIPALFFTDGEVQVFIGTYGNTSKGFQFQIGRLSLYFRFNIFNWRVGMCRNEGHAGKLWQHLLITIGGPIASLSIAIPILLMILNEELSTIWIFVATIFFVAASIDFFVNILPTGNNVFLDDGSLVYSDGDLLLLIISRFLITKEQSKLLELFEKSAYEEVLQEGDQLLQQGKKKRFIYEYMAWAYIKQNDYQKALEVYKNWKETIGLKDADYLELASIYFKLNQYLDAIDCYDQYLYKSFTDVEALNERGKAKLNLGDYQEALIDFEKAIYHSNEHKKYYKNRALARVRLKNFAGAEQDLKLAMEFDCNDPEVYYYWGELYNAQSQKEKALVNYKKAKALGSQESGLDFKIDILQH